MSTTWTKRQQKAHRKAWAKALLSGKYKQARNKLRTESGAMCCLGVACEISNLSKWDGGGYLEEDSYLPVQVRDWLGLSDRQGYFRNGDSTTKLTYLNDSRHLTFAEIADIIEAEPDGLVIK